jgi:hypothetical protein
MSGAYERVLDERSGSYPKKASFIDADGPHVGETIRRAVDGGYAVVLVASDGSTRTLRADSAQS